MSLAVHASTRRRARGLRFDLQSSPVARRSPAPTTDSRTAGDVELSVVRRAMNARAISEDLIVDHLTLELLERASSPSHIKC